MTVDGPMPFFIWENEEHQPVHGGPSALATRPRSVSAYYLVSHMGCKSHLLRLTVVFSKRRMPKYYLPKVPGLCIRMWSFSPD